MPPEVLEEQLIGTVYEDAQSEAEVAALLVDHWKNSPHRVLSLAEQQMQVEGFPVQPVLLKFRYWGLRAIEFNFSRLWDFLCPITFGGVVVRLSIFLLFLEYVVGTAVDSYQMRSLQTSEQVQVSQVQE